MAERCAHLLGTDNFSSVSHALRRASSLAFVRRLLAALEATHTPGAGELVGVDGMAVSLPRTQRHRCAKMNRNTVGGGVVWAYMIKVARGTSPVKILRTVEGAWHDTRVMGDVELVPRGPIYLMDRGFYAFALLGKWLKARVRFIVRARQRDFVYTTLRVVSAPRRIGAKHLKLDAIVRLGAPSAKLHPRVRLVIAVLASGERLMLVSDRLRWSAEAILSAYHKRWHIERFHRFVKQSLGLAHLYSFHQSGIMFLVHVAVLLAMLLVLAEVNPSGETIQLLHAALRAVRRSIGLGSPWRANTYTRRRTRRKPPCQEGTNP